MLEKCVQAEAEGVYACEVKVSQVKIPSDERAFCDNCETCIVDLHRSCNKCGDYDLCLSCCKELRQGLTPGGGAASNMVRRSKQGKAKNKKIITCQRLVVEVFLNLSASLKRRLFLSYWTKPIEWSTKQFRMWEVQNVSALLNLVR